MKKHIFLLMAVIATMVSCAKFDYEAIFEQLRDHEERIQKLETMCNQLNTNITALQAILEAISGNDYVTNVVKIMENGKEIGYSISFAKSGTVTIYHGADGEDGADGSNGTAPKIGIQKASDGEYYWTVGDEWLTDESGAKIPAAVPNDPDGKYITPSFRVADGVWYISYDGGSTWKELKDISNGTDSFFQSVTYEDDILTLVLSDGTELTFPCKEDERVVDLFIFMGQSNMAGCGNAADAPCIRNLFPDVTLPDGNDCPAAVGVYPDPTQLRHLFQQFVFHFLAAELPSGCTEPNAAMGGSFQNLRVFQMGISFHLHKKDPGLQK